MLYRLLGHERADRNSEGLAFTDHLRLRRQHALPDETLHLRLCQRDALVTQQPMQHRPADGQRSAVPSKNFASDAGWAALGACACDAEHGKVSAAALARARRRRG